MPILNKYSLLTQLTIVFWFVISSIVITIGAYDYNLQVSQVKKIQLNNLHSISKGVSAAISQDVYTNNFISLERTLLGLNEIPEIVKINVFDKNKNMLADIMRSVNGELVPTHKYDNTEALINQPLSAYSKDESMIIRTPVMFLSKTLAWVQLISNNTLIKDTKKNILIELVYLCGSIMSVTFLIIFFFLKIKLRSLNKLTSFSKELPIANGKNIVLNDAPLEFQSLSQSLNWASKEIEKKNDLIIKENQELDKRVKARTAELERAKDIAETASMAKTDFLSQMSHEFRTPMNAILGFAQILTLESSQLNETQHKHVTEILTAGNHLLALINDVLDLASIESGNVSVKLEEVRLSDIINDCINLVKYQAKARDINIIDKASSQHHFIRVDPMLLKQALINLLSNAVKYNREHGSITIDSEITVKRNLKISISDTGSGLSESDIGKLFSSFERLHAAGETEGTGIGLTITKRLIEVMGGNISVTSTTGEGSTFSIEVPLRVNT